MKRRVFAIVMAALLLMALLTACGGKGSGDSKYVGKYYTSQIGDWSIQEYAELLGITEEEAREFMWIDLKSGGKATFNSDGESEEVSWKVDGDKLILSVDGETMEGVYKDGVITFDMEGEILVMTKG